MINLLKKLVDFTLFQLTIMENSYNVGKKSAAVFYDSLFMLKICRKFKLHYIIVPLRSSKLQRLTVQKSLSGTQIYHSVRFPSCLRSSQLSKLFFQTVTGNQAQCATDSLLTYDRYNQFCSIMSNEGLFISRNVVPCRRVTLLPESS